jgi:tetratricopeptide (TPR) repeat protein
MTQPIPGGQQLPERIGRYKILRLLGNGTMGEVYLGIHPTLTTKQVAIKVINRQLAADPDFRRRFITEGLLVARVQSDYVVQVHDAGEDEASKQLFLVMDLIDGDDLSALVLSPDGVSVPEAVRIVRDVAMGLADAHNLGITHRDVKPANIMRRRQGGQAKLTDFGLAISPGTVRIGSVAGTYSYMSPEQLRRDEVTPQSDVYSLGIVFYQLLTGRHPCCGPADTPPPFPRHVPPDVRQACLACLCPAPGDRSTAKALADVLNRQIEQEARQPWTTPLRRWLAAMGVLSIVLVVAAIVLFWWARSATATAETKTQAYETSLKKADKVKSMMFEQLTKNYRQLRWQKLTRRQRPADPKFTQAVNDFREAVAQWEKLIAPATQEDALKMAVFKAELALDEGRSEDAKLLIQKVASQAEAIGLGGDVNEILGDAFAQVDDRENALPYFRRSLIFRADSLRVQLKVGWTHLLLGHMQQAIADYTRIIDRPNRPQQEGDQDLLVIAHFCRGFAYIYPSLIGGEQAFTDFDQVVRLLGPADVDFKVIAVRNRALAARASNDPERRAQADADFRTVIASQRGKAELGDREAAQLLSEDLCNLSLISPRGDGVKLCDEAVRALQKAQIPEEDPVWAFTWFARGTARFAESQIPGSIADLERVEPLLINLVQGPGSEDVRPLRAGAAYNLGQCFVLRGKLDEAMEQFDKALTVSSGLVKENRSELFPAWLDAHYGRGLVFLGRGQDLSHAGMPEQAALERGLAVEALTKVIDQAIPRVAGDPAEYARRVFQAFYLRHQVNRQLRSFPSAAKDANQAVMVSEKYGKTIATQVTRFPNKLCELHRFLGHHLAQQDLQDKAQEIAGHLERVLSSAGWADRRPDDLTLLAAAYSNLERFDEAVTRQGEALQLTDWNGVRFMLMQHDPMVLAAHSVQLWASSRERAVYEQRLQQYREKKPLRKLPAGP